MRLPSSQRSVVTTRVVCANVFAKHADIGGDVLIVLALALPNQTMLLSPSARGESFAQHG